MSPACLHRAVPDEEEQPTLCLSACLIRSTNDFILLTWMTQPKNGPMDLELRDVLLMQISAEFARENHDGIDMLTHNT